MAWETRRIEGKLKQLLAKHFEHSPTKADEIFGHYTEARRVLVENILPEIKAIEKNLTDHSEDHIGHVLDNVDRLLGDHIDRLNGIELYFLCMTVLFHDVGNIHGRKGHYDKTVIQNIYNFVRNKDPKFAEERNWVCLAASVHSGKASDGSSDTMKGLPEKDVGLFNEGISLRKFAPLLRFADELAEGPQRTSNFMLRKKGYEKKSEIHHKYALVTSIYIDRGNNRISLTYNIDVTSKKDGSFTKGNRKELSELLRYIYYRIGKLNDERKYNKFYSRLLQPFNRTDVRFNFSINGLPCETNLEELSITDLTLPESSTVSIEGINSDYTIPNLIERIEGSSKNINTK